MTGETSPPELPEIEILEDIAYQLRTDIAVITGRLEAQTRMAADIDKVIKGLRLAEKMQRYTGPDRAAVARGRRPRIGTRDHRNVGVKQAMRLYLAKHPSGRDPIEIREAVGFTAEQVRSALQNLRLHGEVDRKDRTHFGYVWFLTDKGRAAMAAPKQTSGRTVAHPPAPASRTAPPASAAEEIAGKIRKPRRYPEVASVVGGALAMVAELAQPGDTGAITAVAVAPLTPSDTPLSEQVAGRTTISVDGRALDSGETIAEAIEKVGRIPKGASVVWPPLPSGLSRLEAAMAAAIRAEPISTELLAVRVRASMPAVGAAATFLATLKLIRFRTGVWVAIAAEAAVT